MSTPAPSSSRATKTSQIALAVLLAFGGADWLVLNLLVAPKVFVATADVPSASISQSPLLPSPRSTSRAEPIAATSTSVAPVASPATIPTVVAQAQQPASSATAEASAIAPPTAQSAEPSSARPVRPIHFDAMSAFLSEDARNTLCAVARRMKREPGLRVKVVGHTDTRGEDDLNMRISQRRAESASTFLQTIGIDSSRIEMSAVGATSPVDTTQSWDSNRKNRRVEFIWQ